MFHALDAYDCVLSLYLLLFLGQSCVFSFDYIVKNAGHPLPVPSARSLLASETP